MMLRGAFRLAAVSQRLTRFGSRCAARIEPGTPRNCWEHIATTWSAGLSIRAPAVDPETGEQVSSLAWSHRARPGLRRRRSTQRALVEPSPEQGQIGEAEDEGEDEQDEPQRGSGLFNSSLSPSQTCPMVRWAGLSFFGFAASPAAPDQTDQVDAVKATI